MSVRGYAKWNPGNGAIEDRLDMSVYDARLAAETSMHAELAGRLSGI
jgi:hypothetical protein